MKCLHATRGPVRKSRHPQQHITLSKKHLRTRACFGVSRSCSFSSVHCLFHSLPSTGPSTAQLEPGFAHDPHALAGCPVGRPAIVAILLLLIFGNAVCNHSCHNMSQHAKASRSWHSSPAKSKECKKVSMYWSENGFREMTVLYVLPCKMLYRKSFVGPFGRDIWCTQYQRRQRCQCHGSDKGRTSVQFPKPLDMVNVP